MTAAAARHQRRLAAAAARAAAEADFAGMPVAPAAANRGLGDLKQRQLQRQQQQQQPQQRDTTLQQCGNAGDVLHGDSDSSSCCSSSDDEGQQQHDVAGSSSSNGLSHAAGMGSKAHSKLQRSKSVGSDMVGAVVVLQHVNTVPSLLVKQQTYACNTGLARSCCASISLVPHPVGPYIYFSIYPVLLSSARLGLMLPMEQAAAPNMQASRTT
jgi:hypothetical protein